MFGRCSKPAPESFLMSGTILIVDDLSINRTILRARLTASCYACLLAKTGQEAIEIARAERPNLILLDYRLPDMDGDAVCECLRADSDTANIPLLIFSASTDRALRLRALSAGADDFLTKPIDESYLLGRMRSLMRARDARTPMTTPLAYIAQDRAEPERPPRREAIVLVSEAPAQFAGLIEQMLPGRAVNCLSVQQALRLDQDDAAPDLILLAHDVVQSHGLQIVSDLRSRAGTRTADLCLILPDGFDLLASMALDLGATEVLRLPLDLEEGALRLAAILRNKDRNRAQTQAMVQQLGDALRDPLTGLFNRRHLVSELWRLVLAAPQTRETLGAILVIDLDHFKSVNDRYGHNAGDDVLVDLSRRLRANLRMTDLLTRYGGEEFVVLLPGADLSSAQLIAERLGHAVQSRPCLPGLDGAGIRVTASIGVGLIRAPQSEQTPEQFARDTVAAADLALRAAKMGGRNRIMAAGVAAMA